MRLLNTTTLRLKEFLGESTPEYVILSHTWDDDEVLFEDIQNGTAQSKKGFSKITNCCRQATMAAFDWVWIDTCCIDKSSSSELSEAINSMYAWYKQSKICYAFLADVMPSTLSGMTATLSGRAKDHFIKSRWFTRGWTLQELIAPSVVQFYSAYWVELSTKASLKDLISEVTGIDIQVLGGSSPSTCNVARRLSWASMRETTRIEDAAYCLLGFFDVNMPLLYGEGMKAFRRLQEEILKEFEDYTILAWKHRKEEYDDYEAVLAPSPSSFCRLSKCTICRDPSSGLNWDYQDLVHFPLSVLNSVRNTVPKGLDRHEPDTTTDLPTFTGRRFRIVMPMCKSSEFQERRFAYIGLRIGERGQFLCLMLTSTWTHQPAVSQEGNFLRRLRLIQVPESHMHEFKPAIASLVSWSRSNARFFTWNSPVRYFTIPSLPECLSVLSSAHSTHDLQSGDIALNPSVYPNYASFVLRHRCTAVDGEVKDLNLAFGAIGGLPWCQLEKQEDVADGRFVIQGSDRAKSTDSMGIGSMVSVSVKVRPSRGNSVARYALGISCGKITG